MIFNIFKREVENISLLNLLCEVYKKILKRYPELSLNELNLMLDKAKFRQHKDSNCRTTCEIYEDSANSKDSHLSFLFQLSHIREFGYAKSKYADKLFNTEPFHFGLLDLNRFRRTDIKNYLEDLDERMEFTKKLSLIQKEIDIRQK